jgi:hypothetical protein
MSHERTFFAWLISHEKLVAGVTLVLVLALVAQVRFCKSRVEPGADSSKPSTHSAQSSSVAGISGTWEMSVQKRRSGTQTWTLNLQQSGEQLNGVINSEGGDLIVTGTIKGQAINLSGKRFGVTVEFPATLTGDMIVGEMNVLTVNRHWTARRRT